MAGLAGELIFVSIVLQSTSAVLDGTFTQTPFAKNNSSREGTPVELSRIPFCVGRQHTTLVVLNAISDAPLHKLPRGDAAAMTHPYCKAYYLLHEKVVTVGSSVWEKKKRNRHRDRRERTPSPGSGRRVGVLRHLVRRKSSIPSTLDRLFTTEEEIRDEAGSRYVPKSINTPHLLFTCAPCIYCRRSVLCALQPPVQHCRQL